MKMNNKKKEPIKYKKIKKEDPILKKIIIEIISTKKEILIIVIDIQITINTNRTSDMIIIRGIIEDLMII